MAQSDDIKNFQKGGMDQNSAPESVDPNDYIEAWNLRDGSKIQEENYKTNLPSINLLSGILPSGINGIIGGGSFDNTGQILVFRYNSAGNCQILLYNNSTNTYTVIFTDKTDSGGQTLLPLNPQNTVLSILINKTYAVWWGQDLEAGYCNLITLAAGGYGPTVLWEDLSLLKPQCIIPPTGTYGSDAGQPANYLYGLLPQFTVQYVNADFNKSAWSTRSERIVPYQENTPILGQNVGQNNYIIVGVNLGSIRNVTTNIACQFDDLGSFSIIKSVNNADALALTHTSVDVSIEVYEAYDPATNTYYFAFYNNTILIPVPATETDLSYDYIWPANAGAQLNGNIIALGAWKTLYPRPTTSVTIAAVGYNPNIGIPAGTYPDPLTKGAYFPGASGSGAGNHRRNMWVILTGTPNTGDIVVLITADIRSATTTRNYTYTVPLAQDGNLLAVVQSISATLSGSYVPVSGGYQIFWTDVPYFGLQTFSVELYFAGASVANSVPEVLDNTNYQLAISYFDYKMRYFPLCTGKQYFVTTPSYAQQKGNATQISVTINTAAAPAGAVGYQVLTTKPPVTALIDTIATLLVYKGAWNARTNSPSLSINSGNIGDTYQITTPFSQAAQTGSVPYTNLGTGEDYKTGDFITIIGGTSGGGGIGMYYKVLPRNFGNLAQLQVGILCFSLNSLKLLNDNYAQNGVTTNLVYDFSPGDRCTLHYWIDGSGNIQYFNSPCIELAVLGYDVATSLLKVENSAALTNDGTHIYYNGQQIDVRNIFLRIYSPQKAVQTASISINGTVWYEVGQRFSITNGLHDTLNFNLIDGGAYYKTRQFPDAILPYGNPPVNVIATDLNYSDFYASNVHSFGRARTYNDEKVNTEQAASIITSQPYILGSQNNGLNRFYPANIYGEGDGQTSSSKGAIQIMWQRGQELVTVQSLGTFYIPVNEAYTVLNAQLTGQSISEKLLNNGRYDPEGVGLGQTKCFCTRYSIGYGIDPNKSLPFKWTLGGIEPIGAKMSKYFKSVLQLAYSQGKKIQMMYDDYYEEVVLTIQADSGVLILFPFSTANWNPLNGYTITPGEVTLTPNGAHCTASYDSMTGIVTYTPDADYVGGDTASFTFNPGSGDVTVNNCLTWTAGTTTVNPFVFTPRTGQPLSTYVQSINNITVSGPNVPVPISISGASGQYRINGGAFTSAPGTVVAGDVVDVENMSSASNSTTTTTTLTIGATSGTFDVTTLAASAGHFTADSQYGVTITSIVGTGVPGGFASVSIGPGQSLTLPYTTLAIGNVDIQISGTPVLPAKIVLYEAGVDVGHIDITGAGAYTIHNPNTTNTPTTVQISINLQ